jgi:hypothetical protein
MVLGQIIWAPEEIEERLERYHEDDSLFDVPIARLAMVRVCGSSGGDPMVEKGYRLLKRAELDRAIQFLIFTDNYLHTLIRVRYIRETPIDELEVLTGRPNGEIHTKIGKALEIMTKYLNKKNKPR